jgi:hypothetical protein
LFSDVLDARQNDALQSIENIVSLDRPLTKHLSTRASALSR